MKLVVQVRHSVLLHGSQPVLFFQHFQDFIRSRTSPWYSSETHLGCWRQLTVRTSRNNHILIMISFCQGQLSAVGRRERRNFFERIDLG